MIRPIDIALMEYGEKEIPGPKDNKRITQYFTAVPKFKGAHKDATPHCSAFVNWCLGKAGIPGTGSAMARSFEKWGMPCGPVFGSVAVFWRGKKNSPWGHVTFCVRQLDKVAYCLGANQNDQVNITGYPLDRLLGYRIFY